MPRRRTQTLEQRQAWMRKKQLQASETHTANALEQHYTIQEMAKALSVSEDTTMRLFEREPGVVDLGLGRKKRNLRIPQSVVDRVYRRRANR